MSEYERINELLTQISNLQEENQRLKWLLEVNGVEIC